MGVDRVLEENKEMMRGTYVDEIIRLEGQFFFFLNKILFYLCSAEIFSYLKESPLLRLRRKVESLMDMCNEKFKIH